MDHELVDAARWEETDKKPPVRVSNKKKNKNKKKKKSVAGSAAGSVAGGSVAGSVRGQISRPVTPAPYASSSSVPGGVALQSAAAAAAAASASQSESDWAARSESDVQSPEEFEVVSPWGKNARRREKSYNYDTDQLASGSDFPDLYRDGYEPDSDEAINHSSYIMPNYYYNEDPSMEYEGYEAPYGLLRENDGDRAERAGEPAAASFDLPVRRHPTFDDMFFGPERVNLRHIAGKTGTHLQMPLSMDEPRILMWGKPTQIAIARRELLGLVEHILREFDRRKRVKVMKHRDAWERIKAAPSDRKQRRIEDQIREQFKRKRLRHPPPKEPFEFGAVGSFVWPSKEIRPQDVLGLSYEALDDIRYECEVYIMFVREKGTIEVLGDDHENVQQAVDRIFGTFCEIAARNRRPKERFLLHVPSMNLPNVSVGLIRGHNLGGRHITAYSDPMTLQAMLSGDTPSRKFLETWKVRREKLERANFSYLKQMVQQGLNDVLYFRGHATLKIQFGTLVFFGHPGSSPPGGLFTLEEFGRIMRDPRDGPAGELIRFIGEEHTAKALVNECLRRKDLFQPVETSNFAFDNDAFSDQITVRRNDDYITPHSVTPEPALEATLNLKMFDGKCSHDIRLEIEFVRIPGRHPDELTNERGDLYKAGARRWLYVRRTPISSKMPAPHTRCKGPLDVKVLDVENDLAWQVELATYPLCKDADVYPIFTEFVRKLRIEDIPDESDPIPPPVGADPDRRRRVQRVSYVNLPGMAVENVIMKTKYQYWIRKTSYLFEVTRYEWFPTDEVNDLWTESVPISWRGVKTNHDTRWGASLSHQDWVNALSKQTMIGMGCSGGWDPDVDAFFQSSTIGGFEHPEHTRSGDILEVQDPWEGDGWKELMTRISECARLIARVRKESLEFSKPGYAGPEEFDE